MKQKIIEALKQGYKNLGLEDSAFERVAGLGETFITEEAQIENFVKGAEPLLKGIQSEGDKLRTANKRIAELEKPAPKPEPEPEPKVKDEPPTEPQPQPQPQDLAKMIADAVAAAVKPLNDKLAGFERKQTVEAAIAEAKAKFSANDYVKKYKTEADDAWERVMELHEFNKNWTSDEMVEKARGYFDKSMSRKNVDTSKPFEGGSSVEDSLDLSGMKQRLADAGLFQTETKP